MHITHRFLRAARRPLLASCAATVLLGSLPAVAGALSGEPVQDMQLATIRGGFSDASGQLVVSFGIQRAVYINGQLAASTSYQMGDVSSGGQASAAGGSTLLVQNGAGNSAVSGSLGNPAMAAAAAATIVQNSLSNQKIQTLTSIDVTANSLQVFRSSNLQSVLGAGITASLIR